VWIAPDGKKCSTRKAALAHAKAHGFEEPPPDKAVVAGASAEPTKAKKTCESADAAEACQPTKAKKKRKDAEKASNSMDSAVVPQPSPSRKSQKTKASDDEPAAPFTTPERKTVDRDAPVEALTPPPKPELGPEERKVRNRLNFGGIPIRMERCCVCGVDRDEKFRGNVCDLCESEMRRRDLRRYRELSEDQRQTIANVSLSRRAERDEEVAEEKEKKRMGKQFAQLIAQEVLKQYRSQRTSV
ncbi:unnamed protein product, partial [Symbiodinium sp. CCMP2456]